MKQIGMKQIFNSVSIVVVALLSLCQVRLAFAQLNTFEAGQPIRASEMNHNFEVVQEQIEEISTSSITDAGCSATQQENSVLIECSDGTSGVIAGAGRVVVYPEGQVGEVPLAEYASGDIVIVDANGITLAQSVNDLADNPLAFFANLALGYLDLTVVLYNNEYAHSVELLSYNAGSEFQASTLFFKSSDCSGPAWLAPTRGRIFHGLVNTGDKFYVVGVGASPENLLFESRIISAHLNYNGHYRNADPCEAGQFVTDAYLAAEYTPAPEILNAAYPVRLEQLP
jgi:hypothetical protein